MAEEKVTKRKAPKRMLAYIGKLETSDEQGVAAVFTVYKTCDVGEKTVRETAASLGPGLFDVLTGRLSKVKVREEKKCVVTLTE